jgi:hypothetical protein
MFRFSIRDVLWLTALVAALAAWWVDHRGQVAEIRALKEPVAGFDIRAIEEFQSGQLLPP